MISKIKIVAIEGIDGVGKSTFSKVLADGLRISNIAVAKTPYNECNELALMAKSEGSVASFCGYLIGDICISKQFQKHQLLILDRYILSTLVYHDKVVSRLNNKIFSILEFSNIIKPTITILLEANLSIIDNRLILRKEISKTQQSYLELQKKFEKYVNDPRMQPWLGKLIKIRSESLVDHQNAVDLVSKILNVD